MRLTSLTLLVAATLAGCATGTSTYLSPERVSGPRLIALDAPRAPWVVDIEARLRKEGFRVLRWASTTRVTQYTSSARAEEYRKSEARYILVIDGDAPLDVMNRCFGGGYKFSSITAELVDTQSNETIVSVSGAGYSEGCQPMSGTIFGDITRAVAGAWNR